MAEVFSSLQGEGKWIGIPSSFVRVSGCNLRCVWCDTPYASWEPEGKVIPVDDLVDQVAELGNKHVVVTGGEPMIFEPVEQLCWHLAALGHTITIETAGTTYRRVRCHLMSISPKLASSAPPASSGWRDRHNKTRTCTLALRKLIETYPCQLKFVVGDDFEQDIHEIRAILSDLPRLERERILLMPEGVTSETLKARQERIVEICLAEGWSFCPRLHIDLFGNKRGT